MRPRRRDRPRQLDRGIKATGTIGGVGSQSQIGQVAYTVAKHAVVGLMRSYALELAPHHIRVNTVHPTGVATPMIQNRVVESFFEDHSDLAELVFNPIPIAVVEPADISEAVLFLISEAGHYVTGTTLPVDPATSSPRLPAMAKGKDASGDGKSPSDLIDGRIEELGDWRGETLAKVRAIVKEADPDVVEEWKWRGVPTWYHDGIVCTGETYKAAVKMTFAKGASLDDPSGLFNSSLGGNTRRAIDFHEGDEIDEEALAALIQEAVALNQS